MRKITFRGRKRENIPTGTVSSFSANDGYTSAELVSLTFDGVAYGGKMNAEFPSDELRAGDEVVFTANISRVELPSQGAIHEEFIRDVRYNAPSAVLLEKGKSSNIFLRLNGALYDVLHDHMGVNEADVSYALLTGNSRVMDGSLSNAVRSGGIAHIFAVSGLHIGILFAAVSVLFKPLKRFRVLPAAALSLCYSAVCGFTVSSLRAVIMCTALGLNGALGRKGDFLGSISFAAIAVLLLFPAQWFAVGFRLSFGACVGLALFSGSLSRGMKRLPALLKDYLSANFSVQIFTFPVLIESFGYFSVWGTLLNFFLIPLLPVLFLTVLVCALLALMIAPAAAVILTVPAGMVSAFLFLLAAADFSFVLTGFSLGAGGTVWMIACFLLSEKVRMKIPARSFLAAGLVVLFSLCVAMQNAVITGCKITANGTTALVQTKDACVLIIGDGATLRSCENFLARTYGGRLDAVLVLTQDELKGINVAAFLDCDRVLAREKIPTGLQDREVEFGESFTVSTVGFRYEGAGKLAVLAEETVTEVDFTGTSALGADVFLQKSEGYLIFYLKNGIIYAR